MIWLLHWWRTRRNASLLFLGKEPATVQDGEEGKCRSKPKLRLPHNVIVRAPGLLPMWYAPAELALDLGVPRSTLIDWLNLGAPHRRDEKSRIWIDGRVFGEWVDQVRARRRPHKLAPNQAYCFRCHGPVSLIDPIRHVVARRIRLSGICPQCGAKINRGGNCGKSLELQMVEGVLGASE